MPNPVLKHIRDDRLGIVYDIHDVDSDEIKNNISGLNDWLGYPKNLFDYTFTTTHSSNWAITQDGNDVTFEHLTQWSSGYPRTEIIDLPVGTYHFTADYTGGTNLLALYKGTETFVKTLTGDDEIVIEDGNSYYFRSGWAGNGSVTIENITIISESLDGVVQIMQSDIEDAESNITSINSKLDSLIEDTKTVIGYIGTNKKYINSSGVVSDIDSAYFNVAIIPAEGGKTYWIDASTRWGNCYWAFYDNNNNVLSKSDASPSEITSITNYEVISPDGAVSLAVSYYDGGSVAKIITSEIFNYKTKWNGIKWVCVGDSLTAENIRTTKHYFDYVAEATGISVVNMGYSSSGYARLYDENHAFYQRISSCPVDADVVTIFGSFNDLGAGLNLGTASDTGTSTIAGCINTTIDNLQAVIPLVNLGIVAPTPWDTTQPSTSGQAYNYVEMLKAICARRSIPFLDLWRCSNLRPWDSDFRALAYSKDDGNGAHPDENGHKLIAPRFEAFLDSLLLH